ncbi:MAG: hypothetical protein KGI98_06130 [Euryarchaeota archaeon]|nr:hypothetical protein [Euryarchaeota archaeon]
MQTPVVSSAFPPAHAEVATLRLAGLTKYATLLTLLAGIGLLASLPNLLPPAFGIIALATGLTAILGYIVHDQEAPHRLKGLPRYTTVAALTGASAVYYFLGSLMTLSTANASLIGASAVVTWIVLVFGYLMTVAHETKTGEFPATRAAWMTAFVGIILAALFWTAGATTHAMSALVVTCFAALPQMVHSTQDSA